MKKEKAFTLVELLAVIVILAIILIIAVPGVLSIIDQTKNKVYESQIEIIKEATRNYLAADGNTVIWQGSNPQVTILPVFRLQQEGYLDKQLLDSRNKTEMKHLAVRVKKSTGSKTIYEMVSSTTSEIQSPRLSTSIIPIVFDGINWVKADSTNKQYRWYDYDNQQWANAATVTEDVRQALMDAPVGTVVPMEKINAMFVWIPRFKYKLFNVDGTISPVGNSNMVEDYMIDIKFEAVRTTKSMGTKNGQWLTHPAFMFGDEELEGFWVAKFETGYNQGPDLSAYTVLGAYKNEVNPEKILIKPGINSWRGIQVYPIYQNVRGMGSLGNVFGLTTVDDPHMMKNIEWGAMAYLTLSKYGKQGNPIYVGEEKQVRINNNHVYLTGCGADRQDATLSYDCDTYETVNGQAASTTGNISGIYDTSGGAWDYVAGVMKAENGTDLYNLTLGFPQDELNELGKEGKYFDVYDYGTTREVRSRGHLGDATLEMGPFNNDRGAWYDDYAAFIRINYDSFLRGGTGGDGSTLCGVASFHSWKIPGGSIGGRITLR